MTCAAGGHGESGCISCRMRADHGGRGRGDDCNQRRHGGPGCGRRHPLPEHVTVAGSARDGRGVTHCLAQVLGLRFCSADAVGHVRAAAGELRTCSALQMPPKLHSQCAGVRAARGHTRQSAHQLARRPQALQRRERGSGCGACEWSARKGRGKPRSRQEPPHSSGREEHEPRAR